MYAQPFGPVALPLSRVSTRRPPFSFWLPLILTVARPLEPLISALCENHTAIWRRRFQSISLVLLAVIAGLSGLPVSANAAQQVCVVPERDIAAQRSCITLQELPRWLRRSIRRDASGLPTEDVVVELSAGTFRLASPLVIDAESWKPGTSQLQIIGAGSDRTVISGAVAVRATPVPGDQRLRLSLPAGVVRLDLKAAGVTLPRAAAEFRFGKPVRPDFEVLSGGKVLRRSRWPNSGYATVSQVTSDGLRFDIKDRSSLTYQKESTLMLGGYFFHDWADEVIRGDADRADGTFGFAGAPPAYGVKKGQRVWIENALQDIDLPGEWAYDAKSGSIFALPISDGADAGFEVSKAVEGWVFSNTGNIVVRDIGFSAFRDNAVRVDRGLNIELRSVNIRNIGGAGMRLNGTAITAEDIDVKDTGAAGIGIGGGDRQSLVPGHVAVRRCRIERVGRLLRSYNPAVGISGVGNELSDCILRTGPHAAVVFHGNDHLIQRNLIEQFAQDTDDVGALYTGRDWTARGTIIRENVIRDIGRPGQHHGSNAVYLDDQASGIVVENNLFVNSGRGILIGGGRDNRITGNVFVGCDDGIYIDARGTRDIAEHGERANLELHRKFSAVSADGPLYTRRYPEMLAQGPGKLGVAGGNLADENIFVGCKSDLTVKAPAQGALAIHHVRSTSHSAQSEVFHLTTAGTVSRLHNSLIDSVPEVIPAARTRDIP